MSKTETSELRRSPKSTDLWAFLGTMGLILWLGRGLPPIDLTLTVEACGVAYIICRVLWKKNRGLFYPGVTTSEFLVFLGLQGFILWQRSRGLGLSPGLRLLAANFAVYAIGRGVTKSIGVRNHFV